MKRYVWLGFKFVIPFVVLVWAMGQTADVLKALWWDNFLGNIPLLKEARSEALIFFLSFSLTIASLGAIGYGLELAPVKRILNWLAEKTPFFKYFWGGWETSTLQPVAFQYPMPGQWKIGVITGEQEMSDGRVLHKIYFITGIGDHTFVEKDREDLVIKLDNKPHEILKLILSGTTSGPRVLKIKPGESKK